MIKGCSRKVIVIKNPGSALFEEAYFIVNPGCNEKKQNDLLNEANRIIASKTLCAEREKSRLRKILPWLTGFALGLCTAFSLSYFVF